MANATFVKNARKDYPEHGIKKGESYYWWSFRFGGKHYSKEKPKESQLTQSAFMSSYYSIKENIDEFSCETIDEFESFIEEVVSDIDNLIDETQSALDSMPEHLQESSISNERIEELESWKSDIEGIDFDFDEDSEREDIKEELKSEIESEIDEEDLTQEEIDRQVEEELKTKTEEIESKLQEKIKEKVEELIEELQGFDCNL